MDKNFITILISQLVSGIGFLLIIVGSQTHISLFEPPATKARAFAFISFNASLGQILGPFLGGIIASSYGYRPLFWIISLINLPAFLGLKIIEKKKHRPPMRNIETSPLFSNIKELLTRRELIRLFIFTSVVVFITSLKGSFLPLLFKERGFSKVTIGIFLSLFSISMAIIRLFMDRLLKKLGKEKAIYLVMCLILFGVTLIGAFKITYVILVGLLSWGCAFGISQPLSMYLISEELSVANSGIGMGMRFTMITFSAFMSPLLFGIIGENFSLPAIFYVCAIIAIISNIYFYHSRPAKEGG